MRSRGVYVTRTDEPIGPHLAERLAGARARIDARIGELQELRRRLDEFEAAHTAELAGQGGADIRAGDPRSRAALDSPPGRRL